MARQPGRMRAATLLNVAIAAVFAVSALVLVFIVRTNLRREALREAEQMARALLDRNLATHTYFTHTLKPAVFPLSDRVMPPDYFDPAWMSSTFAVREIDKLFQGLNPAHYYYKECAVNARSPENEADPVERAFIERLNRDPELQVQSMERVLDGRPFFTVMRRGEAMEETCLRCHDTPERAPGDLVARYGPTRSFHRSLDEVITAISIRIPLAAAYAHADQTILQISLALGGGFLGILGIQMLLSRRLVFGPLERVRAKANAISADERLLGEEIPLPPGRELADLCTSFNRMSRTLRDDRDHLERTVAERTAQLRATNEELTRAAAEIKSLGGLIPICAACKKIRDDRGYWQQVESYISAHTDARFSHGICPECLPDYFSPSTRDAAPGEDGQSPA